MLDLSEIVTRLTAQATSLGQIILPESVEKQSVDSSAVLVSTVQSYVSSRLYPMVLPLEPTYPTAIYKQEDSRRIDVDGYPILRTDEYVLATQSETHLEASNIIEQMITALLAYDPAGEAGATDIFGKEDNFYEGFDIHEVACVVHLTHLARTDQTLPAAFVYPLTEDFEDDGGITCIEGFAESRFAVLLVAKIPAGGISALGSLRDEILDALIGFRPTGWDMITPISGGITELHSAYVVWRDLFSTRQPRTYSPS